MNCSGTNTSGAIPVPHGVGLKKSLVSILPGLGDTGSSVRHSQRRRINSAKELTVQYQPGGLFQLLHQCCIPFSWPKRTAQQQKNIQIVCLCLLLPNIAFNFYPGTAAHYPPVKSYIAVFQWQHRASACSTTPLPQHGPHAQHFALASKVTARPAV